MLVYTIIQHIKVVSKANFTQQRSLRVLSHPDHLEKFQNREHFSPWRGLFGDMWTQQLHSDAKQNKQAETALKGWSRLASNWLLEWFVCSENAINSASETNNFTLKWQGANQHKNIKISIGYSPIPLFNSTSTEDLVPGVATSLDLTTTTG